MPSGTPALAHACAQALWPAPEAPFVVKQFRSTTDPVIVTSLPGAAAWPCAARGSAQRASTAVQARIRFIIVQPPVSKTLPKRNNSRVPYVPTGGSRLWDIVGHERPPS